ncbi:MAG: DUF1987 domain-containing protein [Chitinophagales bacterium]|nr:DUF1987 domain-containing protein [Chitinophagales bacterium]
MNQLNLEGTNKTPTISFHAETGTLEIKGRSIPENSVEFYAPLFLWIDAYVAQPKGDTRVLVQLEYFNTSSSKCLLDIFRKLEPLHQSAKSKVTVSWLYEEEDEDMMEAGDDYQTIVKLPFTVAKVIL